MKNDECEMTSEGWVSFRYRAIFEALSYYGANAKSAMEQLKADSRLKGVESNRKVGGQWRAMVKAIEEDNNPSELISFEEAKQAGQQKERP